MSSHTYYTTEKHNGATIQVHNSFPLTGCRPCHVINYAGADTPDYAITCLKHLYRHSNKIPAQEFPSMAGTRNSDTPLVNTTE